MWLSGTGDERGKRDTVERERRDELERVQEEEKDVVGREKRGEKTVPTPLAPKNFADFQEVGENIKKC